MLVARNLTLILSLFLLTSCYSQLKVTPPQEQESFYSYDDFGDYDYSNQVDRTDTSEFVTGYRQGVLDANQYFLDYEAIQQYDLNRFNGGMNFWGWDPFWDPYWNWGGFSRWGWQNQFWGNSLMWGGFDPFFDPFHNSLLFNHSWWFAGRGWATGGGFFPNYYTSFGLVRDQNSRRIYGPRSSGVSLSEENRASRTVRSPRSSSYWGSIQQSVSQSKKVNTEYLRPGRTTRTNSLLENTLNRILDYSGSNGRSSTQRSIRRGSVNRRGISTPTRKGNSGYKSRSSTVRSPRSSRTSRSSSSSRSKSSSSKKSSNSRSSRGN